MQVMTTSPGPTGVCLACSSRGSTEPGLLRSHTLKQGASACRGACWGLQRRRGASRLLRCLLAMFSVWCYCISHTYLRQSKALPGAGTQAPRKQAVELRAGVLRRRRALVAVEYSIVAQGHAARLQQVRHADCPVLHLRPRHFMVHYT